MGVPSYIYFNKSLKNTHWVVQSVSTLRSPWIFLKSKSDQQMVLSFSDLMRWGVIFCVKLKNSYFCCCQLKLIFLYNFDISRWNRVRDEGSSFDKSPRVDSCYQEQRFNEIFGIVKGDLKNHPCTDHWHTRQAGWGKK